jgi:hypothetical protein
VVGCTQPSFQVAAAARQPAAAARQPAATNPACRYCCKPTALWCSSGYLPPSATTVGLYRRFKRQQELNRRLKRRFRDISTNVNPTIYFHKIEEKYI